MKTTNSENTMDNMEALVRHLSQQFEARFRSELARKPKAWLIDQLMHISKPSFGGVSGTKTDDREAVRQRAGRIARIRELNLCTEKLNGFLKTFSGINRNYLLEKGLLKPCAPEQGTRLITAPSRSAAGETLLARARDIFFALLFGDSAMNICFKRTHREILSLTVPGHKAFVFDDLQAVTQHRVLGTWRDPASVSNDLQAENILLEIEYGETDCETVGNGILLCLHLINLLEVNEQILYARMSNVEQSSLSFN